MTPTTIIVLNGALALLTAGALPSLIWLAHRLPAAAPHHDRLWGRGGDPWVVSDPLPLAQVVAHERERRAAI